MKQEKWNWCCQMKSFVKWILSLTRGTEWDGTTRSFNVFEGMFWKATQGSGIRGLLGQSELVQ